MDNPGRILGLDIGHKRTGVALSDETQLLATPYSQFDTTNRKAWLESIQGVIQEYEVTKVVVGLPLNHHGEAGRDAETIGRYISALRSAVSVPVVEWDERFTTCQAERSLLEADVSRAKRKQVIDKVAAAIILQSYLDSLRFSLDSDEYA